MISDLKIFLTKDKLAVLESFTTDEQAVLREFIIRNTNAVKFLRDDYVVEGLVKQRVLILINPLFKKFNYANRYYPYRLNRFIVKKLNPQVHLYISANPNAEEIASYANQRPNCMKYVRKLL